MLAEASSELERDAEAEAEAALAQRPGSGAEGQRDQRMFRPHYKGFPICQAISGHDELRSDSSMGSVAWTMGS